MQHLLPIAFLAFSIVGLWSVFRNGPTPELSVSLHVAQAKVTRIVFGIVMSVSTLLMSLSLFGWLLPHYSAGIAAYFLFGLVVISFIVIALVPHIEKTWREPVHNLAAWGVVYLVPIVILCVLFWPLSGIAFWLSCSILAAACALLLLALFRRKKYAPVFLYFQITYLALFFALLLVITYC